MVVEGRVEKNMESYLNENFDLTSKNPTDEALRWKSRLVALIKEGLEVQAMYRANKEEDGDEEDGGEKKDKGGGGKGGGGGSEKKDKEGGGRAGEKKGELRKMGANKVYGGCFTFGPGTCAEAVVDEPKQEEWLLTVVH